LLCCCVGIAIAVATSFATYLQQSIACLSEVSVCAVFLTTVIASLTSPSVMGLPRIVARAFPTDCKTTGCTSVAELHQQQGSSTHRQASCCSAISPRLRARHIRQPTSYHSLFAQTQPSGPATSARVQRAVRKQGSLAFLAATRSRPCTPRPPRAVFRRRLHRELPKRVISIADADSNDQRDSRQCKCKCKWGSRVSWPALEPGHPIPRGDHQMLLRRRVQTMEMDSLSCDGCVLLVCLCTRVLAPVRPLSRRDGNCCYLASISFWHCGTPAQQTPLLMSTVPSTSSRIREMCNRNLHISYSCNSKHLHPSSAHPPLCVSLYLTSHRHIHTTAIPGKIIPASGCPDAVATGATTNAPWHRARANPQ
jgi:hypothetical protein